MILKLHPDLALAALHAKQDRLYRIWVLARALDLAGNGRVSVSDLGSMVQAHGLTGLSPGTLRRLLKQGDGKWWTLGFVNGDKCLFLRGLFQVCKTLKVKKLVYAPIEAPIRWAKSLRGFRSLVYASIFPGGDVWSNPISRKLLEKLTGKTARTQRDYDKVLGSYIEKQDNAIVTGVPLEGGTEIPAGYFVDKVVVNGKEVLALFKRLPNSFRTGFKKTARGMMRAVNQRLRYSLRNRGRDKREKLFYRKYKAARRRIRSLKKGDWLAILGAEFRGRHVSKTRGGCVLWTPVQVHDGQVFFS